MEFDTSKLQNGDVIIFHTKGFSPISVAIRTITESYWNHCGVYIEEADGKGYVVEALFKGVSKNPIENYLSTKKYDLKAIRFRKDSFLSEQEWLNGIVKFVGNMRSAIGRKYDWSALIWIWIKLSWRSTSKQIMSTIKNLKFNPLEKRESFFCSELVCESCYRISSLHPFLFQGKTKSDCSTTTPKDVAKCKYADFITGINEL